MRDRLVAMAHSAPQDNTMHQMQKQLQVDWTLEQSW